MLAFCAGKAQGCLARGTSAVNVSFSVLEFVFGEFYKVHKALVFCAALVNFAREHSAYCKNSCGVGECLPNEVENGGLDKECKYSLQNYHYEISNEQARAKHISAVSSVHKTVQSRFDLSHSISFLKLFERQSY